MANSSAPSGKPYVYAFSSGQLVLLVCMVLVLMALSLMLGIRIERHQQTAELEAFGTIPTVRTKAVSENKEALSEAESSVASLASPTQETAVSPEESESASPEPAPAPAPLELKPEASAPAPVAPAAKPEPVKQVAVPKPPAPVAEKKKEAPRGHYAVQITASQDKPMATLQMQILKEKSFPAFIQDVDLGDKGIFFRVLVGPYQSEDEARSVQKDLQKDSRFAGCYVRYLP